MSSGEPSQPRPHKAELDVDSPEYLRAVEFGRFFEELLDMRDQIRSLERGLRKDFSAVMDSFWTFGSALEATNAINQRGPKSLRVREQLKFGLKRAGHYYQAIEQEHGADAITELRMICEELMAIYDRITQLVKTKSVSFAPGQIKIVFSEARHLHGQTRKDAFEAAQTLGQPFKDEMKRIMQLRQRFDRLMGVTRLVLEETSQ